MSMRSCRLPIKSLFALPLLAALLLAGQGGAAESAEGDSAAAFRAGGAPLIAQRPLPPLRGERALVFVGGFGDELSGIVSQLARAVPPPEPGVPELRAYYHWNAGNDAEPQRAPGQLAADIRAFLRVNPGAEVVLIGHSMGAGTALKALQLLAAGEGRFYLLTLDPADRSTRPERPACVAWWGNAWLSHSQSLRDFLPAMGGRWNACAGADMNLHFDGRRPNSWGRLPIHDDAAAFLLASPEAAPDAAPAELWSGLRRQLRRD